MVAPRISVKGIRDGLLINPEEGVVTAAYHALRQAIKRELASKQEFLRGSRVAIRLGSRTMSAAQLVDLKMLLADMELELWAALTDNAETREAAQQIGLATRIPGSDALLPAAGSVNQPPAAATTAAEDRRANGVNGHIPPFLAETGHETTVETQVANTAAPEAPVQESAVPESPGSEPPESESPAAPPPVDKSAIADQAAREPASNNENMAETAVAAAADLAPTLQAPTADVDPPSLAPAPEEAGPAVEAEAESALPAPARQPVSPLTAVQTDVVPNSLLLRETVRSGRAIRYKGHVVVIGDVNPGAEIIAGGNVIVWGKLRGLVHAGAAGDTGAVICAMELSPTQLRIANQIAISPPDRQRKFTPEMAAIRDGQIIAEPWH
jgi:septum formation inhibitor MinC